MIYITEAQLIADLKHHTPSRMGAFRKIFLKEDPPTLADRTKIDFFGETFSCFVKDDNTGKYVNVI